VGPRSGQVDEACPRPAKNLTPAGHPCTSIRQRRTRDFASPRNKCSRAAGISNFDNLKWHGIARSTIPVLMRSQSLRGPRTDCCRSRYKKYANLYAAYIIGITQEFRPSSFRCASQPTRRLISVDDLVRSALQALGHACHALAAPARNFPRHTTCFIFPG